MAARTEESPAYVRARWGVLTKLLREEPPRDLTPVEYAAIVPPRRGPDRDQILTALNAAGFTVKGERCR